MNKILFGFLFIFIVLALIWVNFYRKPTSAPPLPQSINEILSSIIPISTPYPLTTPSASKTLANDYHVFQTFNNCGPAALSMALSYYDINVSQQVLGQALRPYQNPQGDNDDKSTTLQEMAEKSKDYGLIPYHRPNGDIEKIKLFITYDIPVIARTWLKVDDDIGHYRVIKGYNENRGVLIQDDSLQGKNLSYSYDEFNSMWEKFNYEYVVLVPADKKPIAEAILKEETDPKKSWKKAADNARRMLVNNPNDLDARFNLSVALYNIGDYKGSVGEFEKVQSRLPFRTLWYQIEPIQAYYQLGQYDKVFEITDNILNNHNRAFSELYLLRGEMYLKQGNTAAAREEFEKAVFYNRNLLAAKEALEKVN